MEKKWIVKLALLTLLVCMLISPYNVAVFSIDSESSVTEIAPVTEIGSVENERLDDSVIEGIEKEKTEESGYQENIVGLIKEGFIFSFSGTAEKSEATVIGYSGKIPNNLVIPSEIKNSDAGWINSSPVTAIGENAFSNKNSLTGSLTSIKLPDTVKVIGNNAFFHHYSLTSIELNEGLEVIGDFAFKGSSLKEINLPESLLNIGEQAFGLSYLKSVKIPNNVMYVGKQSFSNTLKELSIPDRTIYFSSQAVYANQLEVIKVRAVDTVTASNIVNTKDILSPNIFTGNLEAGTGVVLRAEKPAYTLETNLVNSVVSGSNMAFEINLEYQLNSENEWIEHIPENIQWFKDGRALENETSNKLELINVQATDSGIYHAEVEGNVYPEIYLDVGFFTFTFSGVDGDSKATVTGYQGIFPKDMIIPSEAINSLAEWAHPSPVTAIGGNAFANLNFDADRILTSIEIPNSVEHINTSGFEGQEELTRIDGTENVMFIGTAAFMNTGLKYFDFSSIISIYDDAFNSANMQEVVIVDNRASRFPFQGSRIFANNKELTEATFFDDLGPQYNANEVFSGSPLEKIYIQSSSGAKRVVDLDFVKRAFTPNVMKGVQSQTKLLPLQPRYQGTADLPEEFDAIVGLRHLTLMVAKQSQIETDSYTWSEIPREHTRWFKDGIELDGEVLDSLVIGRSESDSGTYHAVADGREYPKVHVKVTLNLNLPIPPLDPSYPPLNPESKNPKISNLSLRYVSSLDFGVNTVSSKAEIYYSELLEDKSGQLYTPMVVVQDQRPQSERSGWELRVSLDKDLMNGSKIVMKPFIHEEYKNTLAVEVAEGDFIVNTSPQRFAGTTIENNPWGIVSIGMSHIEGPGVELHVPKGTGVGNYSTTINWSLVTGP